MQHQFEILHRRAGCSLAEIVELGDQNRVTPNLVCETRSSRSFVPFKDSGSIFPDGLLEQP